MEKNYEVGLFCNSDQGTTLVGTSTAPELVELLRRIIAEDLKRKIEST